VLRVKLTCSAPVDMTESLLERFRVDHPLAAFEQLEPGQI
jgi:hypothetical protein